MDGAQANFAGAGLQHGQRPENGAQRAKKAGNRQQLQRWFRHVNIPASTRAVAGVMQTTLNKMQYHKITVIIPSFNDDRIFRAIESVRHFDNINSTSLIVMDGGSRPELVEKIKNTLTSADILISEPDNGIFDALNKGLMSAEGEIIGWLGSDDFYSDEVLASDVSKILNDHDLLVGTTAHFDGNKIKRMTYAWPVRYNLNKYGMNNPHFSTFGRASILKLYQFKLNNSASDIEYFLNIFRIEGLRVKTVDRIITFMEEGGFSNRNLKTVFKTNKSIFDMLNSSNTTSSAFFFVLCKMLYKSIARLLGVFQSNKSLLLLLDKYTKAK